MTKSEHITIGGVKYDKDTGLRVDNQDLEAKKKTTRVVSHAKSLHKSPARTHTLNRSHTKNSVIQPTPVKSSPRQTTSKSPLIQKFAKPSPVQPSKAKPLRAINDIAPPSKHPVHHSAKTRKPTLGSKASFAHKPTAAVKQVPMPTSAELKKKHIENALKNSKADYSTKKSKDSRIKRHPKLISIASASLAVLMLAGYFTYINIPPISVRVAAAQAGIAAHYPSYTPSGYSLQGPVAYSNGQVSMKFASNVSTQGFTVSQQKSNWNSSTLKENYVEKSSNGSYETYVDNGLTIYTYPKGAAWMNDGILHTIEGNTNLSSSQIRRIAVSL